MLGALLCHGPLLNQHAVKKFLSFYLSNSYFADIGLLKNKKMKLRVEY